jgi:hypothetical protein
MKLPHWSTSIDAAVTLIPPGLFWSIGAGKCTPEEAIFGCLIQACPIGDLEDIGQAEHEHSLPLAICMAAILVHDEMLS